MFRQNNRIISTYIGTEAKNPDIRSTGIVVSRYEVEDEPAGALAVIGPIRMRYTAAVAYASYISQMCGKLITELLE